jgi:hypothetical protein
MRHYTRKETNMELSLDEELRNAEEDMRNAGEALLMSGFPEDQWELIRKYTASAIVQSQCILFKTLQSLPK